MMIKYHPIVMIRHMDLNHPLKEWHQANKIKLR
jgi:hypothetical protein